VSAGTENERAPSGVRDGIREGILSSIKHDVELRGGKTARLLIAAGVIGVLGAIGVTLLLAGHPFGHHPSWHVLVFSTVWAGLLVVSLAIAFLQVRTPSMPLAQAATIGVLGLGLAGICGAVCPDQHFLHWWSTTHIGGPVTRSSGLWLGALCFGLVTTLGISLIAAFAVLYDRGSRAMRPALPAIALTVLLAPGVALQSVDTSAGVFAAWLTGTFAGAYLGAAAGTRARAFLHGPREQAN